MFVTDEHRERYQRMVGDFVSLWSKIASTPIGEPDIYRAPELFGFLSVQIAEIGCEVDFFNKVSFLSQPLKPVYVEPYTFDFLRRLFEISPAYRQVADDFGIGSSDRKIWPYTEFQLRGYVVASPEPGHLFDASRNEQHLTRKGRLTYFCPKTFVVDVAKILDPVLGNKNSPEWLF